MQEITDRPIISVKEARKILGNLADSLTNDEVKALINQLEHLARLGVNDFLVRKNAKLTVEQ